MLLGAEYFWWFLSSYNKYLHCPVTCEDTNSKIQQSLVLEQVDCYYYALSKKVGSIYLHFLLGCRIFIIIKIMIVMQLDFFWRDSVLFYHVMMPHKLLTTDMQFRLFWTWLSKLGWLLKRHNVQLNCFLSLQPNSLQT